ncbi:MAG: hypothetical protein AAF941_09680 [Pseudomonadota bacterium]
MHFLPTKVGAGVVAAALVASAVPANASSLPCFDEAAMQSARIHDFRVMLMVSALKCRSVSPMTLRSYGTLLDSRSDELAFHGEKVESSLVARYGLSQGRTAFNDYETRIGNYHSGVRVTPELCDDVNAFIKLASRANHAELEMLSKLATNRKIDECYVSDRVAFDGAASTELVAPVAAPAPLPVAEPAISTEVPQMVDGIPTYMTPGSGPSTTPEPLPNVAVAELAAPDPAPAPATPAALVESAQAPAPAPSPRDAKLTQAIDALDAAAAALRDMQGSSAQ